MGYKGECTFHNGHRCSVVTLPVDESTAAEPDKGVSAAST